MISTKTTTNDSSATPNNRKRRSKNQPSGPETESNSRIETPPALPSSEVEGGALATSAPYEKIAPSELKINPEFEKLLMPLSDEEYELLEKSILEHGLQCPVITGKDGTIYDGHTRFKICREHEKDVFRVVVDFGDDEAVKHWIIEQQLGRRNLTTYQRVVYSLKYKESIAAKAKANQEAGVSLKSAKGIDTREEIARIAGVSQDTVSKVEYIEKHAEDALKEQFRGGDRSLSINQAHRKLKRAQKPSKPGQEEDESSPSTPEQTGAEREVLAPETPSSSGTAASNGANPITTPEESKNAERHMKGLLEVFAADKNIDLPARCLGLFQDCFNLMSEAQQMKFVAKFSLFLQKQGYGGDSAVDAAAESM